MWLNVQEGNVFIILVVKDWVERQIAQWVHHEPEESIQRPIAPFKANFRGLAVILLTQ